MSVSHLRTQGPRGQEVLQRSTLQGIAAQSGPGAAQAQAWLRMLEQPTPEVVELPTKAKRLHLVGLYFDGHLVATEKLQVTR